MASPPSFCLPIRTPIFNDRIKLVPWETDVHCANLVSETRHHANLFSYMVSGPFPTVNSFREQLELPGSHLGFPANPEHLLFAVIDKTRPPSPEDDEGELAGLVGYIFTSAANLRTEIGPVITLPRFQGSHVTRNAVGLLLEHAFQPPQDGGLGLRRVQWVCNAANLASIKVAENLGFEKVGLIPWHWRYINGKTSGKIGNGKPLPPGSDPDDVWRDTLLYTLGWDVWEEKAREKVEKAMAR